MRYDIRTVTPLAEVPLPFDLDEAKAHLRVEASDTSDAVLIEAMLRAAVDHVERFTSQVLSPREMEISWDRFPSLPELLELPRTPVTAVSSLAYTDGAGATVALDEADWRWSESAPDQVLPAFGASWPYAALERGSVRLEFEAGYEVGLAPPSLVAAVKLMLGHLYANREAAVVGTIAAELPLAVQALCAPYRRLII